MHVTLQKAKITFFFLLKFNIYGEYAAVFREKRKEITRLLFICELSVKRLQR